MINPVKGGHFRLPVVKTRRKTRLLTFSQQADIRLFRIDQSFSGIPNGTKGLISQTAMAEEFEKCLKIVLGEFEGKCNGGILSSANYIVTVGGRKLSAPLVSWPMGLAFYCFGLRSDAVKLHRNGCVFGLMLLHRSSLPLELCELPEASAGRWADRFGL